MSDGYFVTEPFGLLSVKSGQDDAVLAAERRKAVWNASFRALEYHASMHISDVTEIIILAQDGATLKTIRQKSAFIRRLIPSQQYAVSRYLSSMTSVRYHMLFPSPI